MIRYLPDVSGTEMRSNRISADRYEREGKRDFPLPNKSVLCAVRCPVMPGHSRKSERRLEVDEAAFIRDLSEDNGSGRTGLCRSRVFRRTYSLLQRDRVLRDLVECRYGLGVGLEAALGHDQVCELGCDVHVG